MRRLLPLLAIAASTLVARAETFDEAMARATTDYSERLAKAADELNAARTRITDEKAPLLKEMRDAEDRIVAAQSQLQRLKSGDENAGEQKRKLLSELDSIRKNTAYMSTLAHDGLTSFQQGLLPGEAQLIGDKADTLAGKLDESSGIPSGTSAVEVAAFLLERTERALGGYSAPGRSLIAGDNQVLSGTFAFIGPEAYFQAPGGGKAGVVRPRAGSAYPVAYPIASWSADESSHFFEGKLALVAADPTGGKALRLSETRGTLLQHIQKGGLVAYAIIAVGCFSLLMILQKLRDLTQLTVDPQAKVDAFLKAVSDGESDAATLAVRQMRPTTRELFETGLAHQDASKEVLEEHLQSVLLEQRLHFERRLQLLSVIATAAPLMGLLGTVVGMVKTFALITVFGTGNAAKLASGISEVLVATELGLVVAIPTLIAHGFLAQRIQRNLSILERYALDFVAASDSAREEKAGTRA
jgi:biopolymer transport protein ExbB